MDNINSGISSQNINLSTSNHNNQEISGIKNNDSTSTGVKGTEYWNKYYGSNLGGGTIAEELDLYEDATSSANAKLENASDLVNNFNKQIEDINNNSDETKKLIDELVDSIDVTNQCTSLEQQILQLMGSSTGNLEQDIINLLNENQLARKSLLAILDLYPGSFAEGTTYQKGYNDETKNAAIQFKMENGEIVVKKVNTTELINYLNDIKDAYKKPNKYNSEILTEFLKGTEYNNYVEQLKINESTIEMMKQIFPTTITNQYWQNEEVQKFLTTNWQNYDGTTPTIFEIYKAQIIQGNELGLDPKLYDLENYLSEEELGTYLYIYETQGEESALDYISLFDDRKKEIDAMKQIAEEIETIIDWPEEILEYEESIMNLSNYISENFDEVTMNWKEFIKTEDFKEYLDEIIEYQDDYIDYITEQAYSVYENTTTDANIMSMDEWLNSESGQSFVNSIEKVTEEDIMKSATNHTNLISNLISLENNMTQSYIQLALQDPSQVNLKENIETIIMTKLNGITDGVFSQFDIISQFTSEVSTEDLKNQYYASILSNSWVLNTTYQTGNAEGSMLPMMIMGAGGWATAGRIWYMTSNFSKELHGGLTSGNSVGKSIVQGLASAALEVSFETFLGTIPFISAAEKHVNKSQFQAILSYLGNMAQEGFEEGAQTYIMAGFNSIVFGETQDLAALNEEALQSFIVGALTSAELGAGELIEYDTSLNTYTVDGINYEVKNADLTNYLTKNPKATGQEILDFITKKGKKTETTNTEVQNTELETENTSSTETNISEIDTSTQNTQTETQISESSVSETTSTEVENIESTPSETTATTTSETTTEQPTSSENSSESISSITTSTSSETTTNNETTTEQTTQENKELINIENIKDPTVKKMAEAINKTEKMLEDLRRRYSGDIKLIEVEENGEIVKKWETIPTESEYIAEIEKVKQAFENDLKAMGITTEIDFEYAAEIVEYINNNPDATIEEAINNIFPSEENNSTTSQPTVQSSVTPEVEEVQETVSETNSTEVENIESTPSETTANTTSETTTEQPISSENSPESISSITTSATSETTATTNNETTTEQATQENKELINIENIKDPTVKKMAEAINKTEKMLEDLRRRYSGDIKLIEVEENGTTVKKWETIPTESEYIAEIEKVKQAFENDLKLMGITTEIDFEYAAEIVEYINNNPDATIQEAINNIVPIVKFSETVKTGIEEWEKHVNLKFIQENIDEINDQVYLELMQLCEQEGISVPEVEYLGSGETTLAFGVGDKVYHISPLGSDATNLKDYISKSDSILQIDKISEKTYGNGKNEALTTYITERLKVTENLTEEQLFDVYCKLRQDGYLWNDVQSRNIGIDKEGNLKLIDYGSLIDLSKDPNAKALSQEFDKKYQIKYNQTYTEFNMYGKRTATNNYDANGNLIQRIEYGKDDEVTSIKDYKDGEQVSEKRYEYEYGEDTLIIREYQNDTLLNETIYDENGNIIKPITKSDISDTTTSLNQESNESSNNFFTPENIEDANKIVTPTQKETTSSEQTDINKDVTNSNPIEIENKQNLFSRITNSSIASEIKQIFEILKANPTAEVGYHSTECQGFKYTQEEIDKLSSIFNRKYTDGDGHYTSKDISPINAYNYDYRITLRYGENLTTTDHIKFLEEYVNLCKENGISYNMKPDVGTGQDITVIYCTKENIQETINILETISNNPEYTDIMSKYGERKILNGALNNSKYGITFAPKATTSKIRGMGNHGNTFSGYTTQISHVALLIAGLNDPTVTNAVYNELIKQNIFDKTTASNFINDLKKLNFENDTSGIILKNNRTNLEKIYETLLKNTDISNLIFSKITEDDFSQTLQQIHNKIIINEANPEVNVPIWADADMYQTMLESSYETKENLQQTNNQQNRNTSNIQDESQTTQKYDKQYYINNIKLGMQAMNKKFGKNVALSQLNAFINTGNETLISRDAGFRDLVISMDHNTLVECYNEILKETQNQVQENNNKITLEDVTTDIGKIISRHDQKYGSGSAIERLLLYVNKNSSQYKNSDLISSNLGAREILKSYTPEQIANGLSQLGYDINDAQINQTAIIQSNNNLNSITNSPSSYMASISQDQIHKNLKYIVDGITDAIKNNISVYHILVNLNSTTKSIPTKEAYQRYTRKFSTRNHNIHDQNGYFRHVYTNGFNTQNVEHRLYLNAEFNDTYKFLELFSNKCKKRGLDYYFKTAHMYFDTSQVAPPGALTRSESAVIYAHDYEIKQYTEICKEIKREHPELTFYNPPIATASVDGWLGYGMEPSSTIKPTLKAEGIAASYNAVRAHILETAVNEGIIKFVNTYGNTEYTSGWTINDLYLNLLYQNVINNYGIDANELYEHLSYYKETYIELMKQGNGFRIGNIDIYENTIKEINMDLYSKYINNYSETYEFIEEAISNISIKYGVDPNNFALNQY